MNATRPLEVTIRISRILRIALDFGLVALMLGLFIQLSSLSDSHQADIFSKQYFNKAMARIKTQPTTVSAVDYMEELHDSESSMWTSFFKWQGQSNHTTGSCLFTSPNGQFPDKFRLLCSGENKQPGVAVKAEPMQIFAAKTTRQSSSTTDTSKAAKHDKFDKQQAVVSGWLDTPNGRKHFDPVSRRWER